MPTNDDLDQQVDLETWEKKAFEKHGVPEGLRMSIFGQESGGGKNLTSPTGVKGRYQVTQATAKQYGLNRDDPWEQPIAAAKYLREGYEEAKRKNPNFGDREAWLAASARYYGGSNAFDAQGNLSSKSIDGLSTPNKYAEGIAKRWSEWERGQSQQPAAPNIAAPAAPQPTGQKVTRGPAAPRPQGIAPNRPPSPMAPANNPFSLSASTGFQAAADQTAQRTAGLQTRAPNAEERDFQSRGPLGKMGYDIKTGYRQAHNALANQVYGLGETIGALQYGDTRPLKEQAAGAGLGLQKLIETSTFGAPRAATVYNLRQNQLAQERRRANDPYWAGSQESARRDEARAQANPTLEGKITRGVTQGAVSAVPMVAAGMAGGTPAILGMTAATQDYTRPEEAALNIGSAVLPIKAGQAISPLAAKLAQKGAQGVLGQELIRRGIEAGTGGATNAAQYAAVQKLRGEQIDPEEMIAQGVTGGVLGTAMAPTRRQLGMTSTPRPYDPARNPFDLNQGYRATAPGETGILTPPTAGESAPGSPRFGRRPTPAEPAAATAPLAEVAAPANDPKAVRNALRLEADDAKNLMSQFEGEGDFEKAWAEADAAHNALRRLRRELGRSKSPEDVSNISALDREISYAAQARKEYGARLTPIAREKAKQARSAEAAQRKAQENAPTAAARPTNPNDVRDTAPLTAQRPPMQAGPEQAITEDLPQIPPTAPRLEQPQAPAGRRVRVGNEEIDLSPEQAARWAEEVEKPAQESEARYKRGMQSVNAAVRNAAESRRKAEAQRIAAKKREIADRLTGKEQAAADRRAPIAQPPAPRNPTGPVQEPTNRITSTEYEGGVMNRYSRPMEGAPIETPDPVTAETPPSGVSARPTKRMNVRDYAETVDMPIEDRAALDRALRSEQDENPRAYGDVTRPGEPGAGLVSFSKFNDLKANNRQKIARLSEIEFDTPEAQQIIDDLYKFADERKINTPDNDHVDNLLTEILGNRTAGEEARQAANAAPPPPSGPLSPNSTRLNPPKGQGLEPNWPADWTEKPPTPDDPRLNPPTARLTPRPQAKAAVEEAAPIVPARKEGVETAATPQEPLPNDSYTEARKRPDGKWQLFYRGTRNEVFPNEVFQSSSDARGYLRAMRAKRAEATATEAPKAPARPNTADLNAAMQPETGMSIEEIRAAEDARIAKMSNAELEQALYTAEDRRNAAIRNDVSEAERVEAANEVRALSRNRAIRVKEGQKATREAKKAGKPEPTDVMPALSKRTPRQGQAKPAAVEAGSARSPLDQDVTGLDDATLDKRIRDAERILSVPDLDPARREKVQGFLDRAKTEKGTRGVKQEGATEPATAKEEGATARPNTARLEEMGLVREYNGRWQYKFSANDKIWKTANSKEGAIEPAMDAYNALPESERISQVERDQRQYAENVRGYEERYKNQSDADLRQKLETNKAEQARLNAQMGKLSVNQRGSQRAASISAQLDGLAEMNDQIRAVLSARQEQATPPTPEVVPPTTVEKKVVAAKAKEEKIDPRTGLTKTQADYVADKIKNVIAPEYAETQGLKDKPRTIEVPGDGKFTVNNIEQATNLLYRLTGEKLNPIVKPTVKRATGKGTTPKKEAGPEYTDVADDAMRMYGHPERAARELKAQVEVQAENFSQTEHALFASAIRELEARAEGKTLEGRNKGFRMGQMEKDYSYDLKGAMERIGKPLIPEKAEPAKPQFVAEAEEADPALTQIVSALTDNPTKQAEARRQIAEIDGKVRAAEEMLGRVTDKSMIPDAQLNKINEVRSYRDRLQSALDQVERAQAKAEGEASARMAARQKESDAEFESKVYALRGQPSAGSFIRKDGVWYSGGKRLRGKRLADVEEAARTRNLEVIADREGEAKPKFVAEAEARLRDANSGTMAGSGARQFADVAIVTGYNAYKAGMRFAEWSKVVIKEAGEDVRPHLRAAWEKINTMRGRDLDPAETTARVKDVVRRVDEIQGKIEKLGDFYEEGDAQYSRGKRRLEAQGNKLIAPLYKDLQGQRARIAANLERVTESIGALDDRLMNAPKEKAGRLREQMKAAEGRQAQLEKLNDRIGKQIADLEERISFEETPAIARALEAYDVAIRANDRKGIERAGTEVARLEDAARAKALGLDQGFSIGQQKGEKPGQVMGMGFGGLQGGSGKKKADTTRPMPQTSSLESEYYARGSKPLTPPAPKAQGGQPRNESGANVRDTKNAQPLSNAPIAAKMKAAESRAPKAQAKARAKSDEPIDTTAHKDDPGFWSKLSTLRKAGLLTSPKTHIVNMLGNSAYQVADEISRMPAFVADIVADAAQRVVTGKGQRSIAGANPLAAARAGYIGGKKGIAEAKKIFKNGLPEDAAENLQLQKAEFKNPILRAYTDFVFNSLGAEDQLFKSVAMQRSLESQAKVMALNDVRAGEITRSQVGNRMKYYRENPTAEMAATAIGDAEVLTFQNENKLSSAIRGGRGQLGEFGNFALDLVLPFDRTPTNIIARTLEMSPVGYVKNVRQLVKAAMDKSFTVEQQREFSRTFGRASTGTGLIYLGYVLAANGLMTGLADPDPKKRAKESAKAPPAAIKLGGRYYEIGKFAPAGALMGVGATIHRDLAQKPEAGAADRAASVGSGLGQVALDLPLLRAAKEVTEDVTRPQTIPGKAGRMAGSFVPSIVSDVGGLTDTYQREGKTFLGGIGTRIPGVRNRLEPRRTSAGTPIKTEWSDAIDPFRSRSVNQTEAGLERRMTDLEISIEKPDRKQGEPDSLYNARVQRGEKWLREYGERLVNDSQFRGLSDDEQKRAIQSLRSHVTREANQLRPNLRSFDPQMILRGIREGERRQERGRARLIYSEPE